MPIGISIKEITFGLIFFGSFLTGRSRLNAQVFVNGIIIVFATTLFLLFLKKRNKIHKLIFVLGFFFIFFAFNLTFPNIYWNLLDNYGPEVYLPNDAHLGSFQVLKWSESSPGGFLVAKDKNKVWAVNSDDLRADVKTIIKEADARTYRVLGKEFCTVGYACYGKDKDNIFYGTKLIEGANMDAFEVIGYDLAGDSDHLYIRDRKVLGLAPHNFMKQDQKHYSKFHTDKGTCQVGIKITCDFDDSIRFEDQDIIVEEVENIDIDQSNTDDILQYTTYKDDYVTFKYPVEWSVDVVSGKVIPNTCQMPTGGEELIEGVKSISINSPKQKYSAFFEYRVGPLGWQGVFNIYDQSQPLKILTNVDETKIPWVFDNEAIYVREELKKPPIIKKINFSNWENKYFLFFSSPEESNFKNMIMVGTLKNESVEKIYYLDNDYAPSIVMLGDSEIFGNSNVIKSGKDCNQKYVDFLPTCNVDTEGEADVCIEFIQKFFDTVKRIK